MGVGPAVALAPWTWTVDVRWTMASDVIDLVDSSSSSSEECYYSPELLSPTRSSLARAYHKSRKRAAVGEGTNVPSSLSLLPAKMCAKTKREKKQESLSRAREWRDNRKNRRGTAPRCGASNAAVGNREILNLASPSSPAMGVAAARTPPPRKMSKSERQGARERARQWHEHRPENQKKRSSNHNWEENCLEEEEVINLTTPSPDDTTEQNLNQQRHYQPNQEVPFAAVGMRERQHLSNTARQPFASSRMAESPPQQRSHRAVNSYAAAGRGNSQHEEETGWACPLCTLVNPQHQSRCGACYHDATAPSNNSGEDSEMQVHDIDNDGDFVLESERSFGFATGASVAGTTHGPRHGVGPNDAVFSDLSGGTSSEVAVREMLSPATLGVGDWGRPRAFGTTSFRGGTNHSPISAYNANRSNAFQLLLSMGSRSSNAFPRLYGSGEDVDNMSYERLLQVFGDGGENRGASVGSIASLPVSIIGDPEIELPEDKRQCSICLENFYGGDERTSLPCLHGFHSSCVNRWLSSNGSCPVCKTSVNGS